jgi:hypothetical protein
MSIQHPPYPPLGKLRLATIEDIPRITEVALAGYSHTPVFPWINTKHHQYPKDSFKGVQHSFARELCNPGYVVLVAVDAFNPSENDAINATIVPDEELAKPRRGQPIVVGVVSIQLSGNSRWHQFNHKGAISFEPGRDRDIDSPRYNTYAAKYEEAVVE